MVSNCILGCEPINGVLGVLSLNQINIGTIFHQLGDTHLSRPDVFFFKGYATKGCDQLKSRSCSSVIDPFSRCTAQM